MPAILELPEVRQRISPFSGEEYHRLGEFNEHRKRTEPIRRIVTEKRSKSPLHGTIMSLLYRLFLARIPVRFTVRQEQSLALLRVLIWSCIASGMLLPLHSAPKLVQQGEDGSVLLHARDVEIHGTTVRYEPQTNKNTIGFWTKLEDWVSWDFQITEPGTFAVEILQGCGKGSGGSEVEFSTGHQVLKMIVQDTGHFQNFVRRDIGRLTLDEPGRYLLSVKPKTKPGVAVMDLRQVVLRPVRP